MRPEDPSAEVVTGEELPPGEDGGSADAGNPSGESKGSQNRRKRKRRS